MRRILALSAAFAVLCCAAPASAHETLPKNWCAGEASQPLVIENFEFSGSDMHDLAIKCGIVDQTLYPDDWSVATQAIGDYCRGLASTTDEPVPFIAGPKPYLKPAHHLEYSLDDGLYGICAVCVTP